MKFRLEQQLVDLTDFLHENELNVDTISTQFLFCISFLIFPTFPQKNTLNMSKHSELLLSLLMAAMLLRFPPIAFTKYLSKRLWILLEIGKCFYTRVLPMSTEIIWYPNE